MIDVFQWFVWPAHSTLHEEFPCVAPAADSAQARRLQCLFAEARAGGVPTRVLFAIALDWARLLERVADADPWNAKLSETVSAADAALYRIHEPLPKSLLLPLVAIDGLETRSVDETPAFQVAKLLAGYALLLASPQREVEPETAWELALVLLGAIARSVATPALEATMRECAQRAYASLFPRC